MDSAGHVPASLKCSGTLDPGLVSYGGILVTEQANGKNVLWGGGPQITPDIPFYQLEYFYKAITPFMYYLVTP